MKFRLSILAATVLCLSFTAFAQSGSIQGKVWVVSYAQAANVQFPAPDATPDATFTTNGMAYIGVQPDNCYAIATFLTGCGTQGYNLTFSGETNPYLGGVVGPDTPMSGSGWGVMIEFTGTLSLTKGEKLYVANDDGIALEIDGKLIPGFTSGVTPPYLVEEKYTGKTGNHDFDLLYANAQGGGAWLLFFPAL